MDSAGMKRKSPESSSTSSSSPRINYEVFLSFRGADTRKGFTDHLYSKLVDAGIQVFRDDEELSAGEAIKPQLVEAIKGSKISIAVLSKDYASSKSCLMEVVQMWECRESNGHTIIPIFYDISPYDVKRQAGDFKNSFEKHVKDEVNADTIKKWKKVLRQIGELSGYDLENICGGHEAQLVKNVVRRVKQVLKKDDGVVTDKLVGIDCHVQEVMRKLGVVYSDGQAIQVCGGDVRVVGICGMQGVGKTTLAEVVFNKMSMLFDGCSFVEGINSQEVVYSQETLISELQGEERRPLVSSDVGIEIISSRYTNMKVLILLDDVHNFKQIEALAGKVRWFGQGSRIIVTTPRKNILKGFDFGGEDKDRAAEEYVVGPMGDQDALQLFRKHAFQGDASQDVSEYDSLSIDIVKVLGGLPMAIVLRAQYLKITNDIEIWRHTRDSLNDHPDERDVSAALEASYKTLGEDTKEIFLDIACFFSGKDKRIPSYMWGACDYRPPNGIELLRDLHLLEVGENNELRMHSLTRDFGRNIVKTKDSIERCRFWNHSDARSILGICAHPERVKCIGLTVEDGRTGCFTCEEFGKMLTLRYLSLDRAQIQGNTEKLPPSLRWLAWRECHLIPELCNMHLKELVILDLSGSPVTRVSKFWEQIREKAEKLKVLNLQGCNLPHASFKFPAPIKLEILVLEDTQIFRIGPFIRDLRNLSSLNLRNCSLVTKLPQELYRMESLTELLIDGTGIRGIHCLEGFLENLEVLSARNCNRLQDISTIGRLRKLSSLDLDGADIDGFPRAFEFPHRLKRLSLRGCQKLIELPTSIGKLDLLEEMDLSLTKITELPESVQNLRNLKTLKMAHTFLREFPRYIVNLKNLEEIDFSFCINLEGDIHCYISGLSSLRILRLSSSSVAGLPRSIRRLSRRLQALDIVKCNQLHALPRLPSSLLSLRWGSRNMTVPDLSYLTNLKELCLNDDEQAEAGSSNQTLSIGWITGLPSLETLELSLPKVANLPGNFSDLTQLRELTLSYMDLTQLPSSSSLWTLRLKHCKIQEPTFSGLKYLSELELEHCDLAKIDGLEDLMLLEVLKISHCNGITNLNGLKGSHRLRKVEGIFSAHPSLPIFSLPVELDISTLEPKDGVEAAIESMEELEDESGQPPVDVETSDRNYAIAAVQIVVGIDDRAKQITDLLEMEVDDEVRILGIYGADGIGKTTLAKAVYERICSFFDGCSFLAEFEATTQNSRGVQFLQTKLIRDILALDCEDTSFDERIGDFLDIFRKMKVLIVVDDVEEKSHLHAIVGEQLHWFGPGSRIIVTSENEEILKEYDPEKARTYTVSALDDGQTLELFWKHAFRMQSSIPDYDGLANRIVKATEKLPLAVEVVGSFLRGKSIQEWAKMEESMKARATSSQNATVGLEEILDMCYKELDQQQKDIFLDIACFISGVDARIASYMWPNCYLPSSGCILMPLAKTGENNELLMHRLPRCLGKRILNQEESQDPRSRRFCTQDMVLKAMNRETGMGNVGALCFDFTAGDFQSMPKIRFLKLDNARVSGNFAGAFASLRWLCWQRCPPEFDAENLVLRELAILELPWSKITEEWGGWSKIKMEKLKVLNLTGCSDLLFTPDFSGYKNLEILILEGCSRLVKLDPSIGHLKRLVSLNLKLCSHLNGLPVELGGATALKELFIDGTSIWEIPISIGNLKQLEILSGFKCFPLTHLPRSISFLTALSELSLHGAKITELPSSLGQLLKLRRLSLRDCRYLEELPYSIGNMVLLEELDVSSTSISKFADSIRNLKSLKVLRMDSSFIRAFPGEIGNLTNLEELHASWCLSLKGAIPSNIKGLRNLRSLTLGHSSISSLPPEISTIPGLHTLDLIQCNELEELPKLPPSLIHLRVSSTRMKAIPLLEDLKELEELCLSDGDPLENRPPSKQPMPKPNVKQMSDEQSFSISFPKLRKLELSLSQIIKLKFEPTYIPQLKTLTLSCLSLKEVSELPKTLSVFELYHSAIEEIEGLKGLEALRRLDISNCNIQNLNGIGQLTSLRSLILSDCEDLSLPDLSNLRSLKVLEIRRCKMIRQIEGIEKLTSLEKLNISECPAENSEQSMEELEDESGQPPVDVETSDSKYTITPVQSVVGIDDRAKKSTDLMEMEVDDESMEKIKDEAGQRPEDMETSDRNYAIAAVRTIVGIDGRAKQITDLLEMEVNDEVRIIGIYGADGIGKTTLAKAVYDRIFSCFDSRSFLAEVDETAQNRRGIQFLQTKLIRDILERDGDDPSFDERIQDFLDIFRERKVLIVVDDVEEQSHLHAIVGEQLHWFGPGSRIIVTSENEEILKEYDPEKARTYTVSALDDGQTLELFWKHAFRMQSSIPDYDGLANRIVKATEKLPLAVEVVGSFLRGKSIQEWAKMEKSMKERTRSSRKTTVGPEEILDIYCKELDQQQKDIFLDIACFISGVDARIASYMWPNCYLPSSGCILMPLAKTGENNELQMHRLPRCLGKRILNQEESQDPRSRRFCTQDMVLKAINRETGMGNVEALCFDFTAGDFQSMPKIRFLKLDNAKVSGNFAGAFASLRWLCWQRCPPDFDAENLVLRELAILELPRGKITEDWGGWSKIKMAKLKVLNLTECSDLLFTPDFSGYKDLEILILEGCSRLVKLDPSIGHLKRLVSLNLKSCSRLNSLPVEMGGMTALKELFIDGTSVRQIPISIGNLKKLEILSGFQCFPLTQLPRSICYLTALSELSFDGAKITELPSSLGDRLKLRRLSLRNCCHLEELPDSIGNMGSSLEELDISATCISELPGSIRNLESLKVLRMDYSFVRAFSGEIGNLTKLEELYASWCRSLKGAVPRDIKRLHHLRSLTLGHSSISSLPSEISTLSSLHTLDLLQCNEIEVLPELPSSLIRLRVSSTRMTAIPILKDLKELEELCLSDEDPKERRPPSEQPMPEPDVQHPLCIWFSRLWNLEFLQPKRIDKQSFLISFPKLRKLELSLSQIIELKFEPTDIPQLKTLTLSGSSLKDVSGLPKTLSVFELYHSAMEEIEGLEGLQALRRLDISNCNIQNLDGIGQLTSLRSLILSDCDCLISLDLSNLESLKVLEIRRCKMIRQIEGIENLTSLQKLNISDCPVLNSVQVQNALKDVMARSTVT